MGNQNEDYLDQLLNSIGNQTVESEKEVKEEKVHTEKKANPQLFHGKGTPGESFLEEFDREMQQLDAEQLIMDYEDSLGEELVGKKTIFGKNGIFGRKKNAVAKQQPVEKPMEEALQEEVVTESVEENVAAVAEEPIEVAPRRQNQTEELDELFAGLAEVMEGKLPVQETMLSDEDEALFSALAGGAEEVVGEEIQEESEEVLTAEEEKEEDSFGFEFGNLFGEPMEEEGTSSADDILEILGEMSGNDDLADIGQMLKAQENNEDISFDDMENGVTEEQALNLIRNRDEEQPVDSEKRKSKWKFNKWNLEKKGFLHKLSRILFGDDEEEQKIHVHAVDGIEDTTAENEELIKAMEKENAAAEKKAQKAEKKKAQAQKQEEKKKIKSAEKKAKDAQRKAKIAEKKAKAPKEVDNTPPLPKKPVFLIFLLAASIIGGVLFAGNGIHYNLCLKSANEAYSTKNYVEAYGHLRNTKTKEKDYELLRKVSILASMQELLRSYTTLYEAKEYEMAVDTLIRIIGRYEENLEEAESLGILSQISELEAEAESILEEEYGLTYEEALTLYSMPSRKKYSVELVLLLREVGLLQ